LIYKLVQKHRDFGAVFTGKKSFCAIFEECKLTIQPFLSRNGVRGDHVDPDIQRGKFQAGPIRGIAQGGTDVGATFDDCADLGGTLTC